ncbi:MAG TPA: hypothetical protein DCF44_00635 [Chitinophagaceae bacterium]|nr:hypothetical protein [Chitinophagaceae bacterium]
MKFTRKEVYNRGGNRLNLSEDISSGWDGNHQGQEQSTDTYFLSFVTNAAMRTGYSKALWFDNESEKHEWFSESRILQWSKCDVPQSIIFLINRVQNF